MMKQTRLIRKGSTLALEDFISNMPDNVVTNILDRLPLQNAVGTSVLSRNWRFKWTMLSQLVFDDKFFAYLSRTKSKNNHVRIISRILLHLRGAITKFVLSIDDRVWDDEDVNHWILFLSRKGIMDLTLECTPTRAEPPLLLSTHLFSCLELKRLKLYNCRFHPPPSFHGFPYLLSLDLCCVQFGSSEIGELFSQCFLLENLNLDIHFPSPGTVKLNDIAKLVNLKILSCDVVSMMITTSSTIFVLLACLPKLQALDLDFLDCKFTEDDATKSFPNTFPHLKTLKLSSIDLDNYILLSCAYDLIRSLPNLQALEIATKKEWDNDPVPAACSPEVDYSIMGPLQLRNVVFTVCCNASGNDVSLIKYLLACSPFLKKFVIHFHELLEPDEKLMFATKVLKLQRAYPAIDIDLC